MSASITTLYVCSHCDTQSPKWQGRCGECGQWGTLEKVQNSKFKVQNVKNGRQAAVPAKTVSLSEVPATDHQRLTTKIKELDRVLGGGFVPSSLILLGGDPGIGKSTLVLQICQQLPGPILYVSGEESAEQIKGRTNRLNLNPKNLLFLGETNIETITATISKERPPLVVIDSIQTVYSSDAPSGPGSVNQVRVCTTKLLEVAKQYGLTILIVGHVTKSGEVAGPKTLEHLVDVVLYLEGSQHHHIRVLRSVKNRFGPTLEVGIFEMKTHGLEEISDPSAIFLTQTQPAPGSVITATLEGSRIFLLEVQALLQPTSASYPQRKSQGFDLNRLQLLVATLSRRLNLKLAHYDIYLNIPGGLRINETAADLAVCLALYAALKNETIKEKMVACGEIGLGGEVRPISHLTKRISEAARLGFTNVIAPSSNEKMPTGITVHHVPDLKSAIKAAIE